MAPSLAGTLLPEGYVRTDLLTPCHHPDSHRSAPWHGTDRPRWSAENTKHPDNESQPLSSCGEQGEDGASWRIHVTHMTHRWCASCSPDSGSSAVCQLCMVYASDCMIMQVVRITRNTHGAQHGGAWGGTHVYRCGTQITCSRGTIFLVLGDTETVLCRLSPPPT